MARPARPTATPLGAVRVALAPAFGGRTPAVWEAASAAGISPSTWSRLEKVGGPLPSGRTLTLLATGLRALGLPVTPAHLLGYGPIPSWAPVRPTPEPQEPPTVVVEPGADAGRGDSPPDDRLPLLQREPPRGPVAGDRLAHPPSP